MIAGDFRPIMEHYGANLLESRIALESQLKVTLSLKRDSVLLWKISFSSAGRKIAPNTGANAIKFFLWRPNPENQSPNWRICFIITVPRDIVSYKDLQR